MNSKAASYSGSRRRTRGGDLINGNVVGVAIIEAPTLYHARMKAAVYGIGKAADYSDGKEVEEGHQALVPRNCIGRLLSANEAQQLFDRMSAARADGATTLEPVEREDLLPVWWISFLDGGVVIMEASSLLHARRWRPHQGSAESHSSPGAILSIPSVRS